jgi:hypothetical protein
MLKKIILGIIVLLVISMCATGLLYANGKNLYNNTDDTHEKQLFHITSSANYGGSISPKGNQSVDKGSNLTFTLEAKDGYKLEWLRVDNVKYKNYASNSYTFTNVDKNHTIQAHFKKIK